MFLSLLPLPQLSLSINPAPTISVAAKGQDANFETRLNAMENAIFKLGSTLEKFISTNNPTRRSRGENDRGYLTDFSVNASQSETDQSSDEESNYGPPPQKKPSSIISNDIFDKEILDGLKIPANGRGICVPILNEAVAKNLKIMPLHKRADERLSDIQKGLIFAASAVLKIADELILAQNKIRPPNLKKVMGHTIDSITLLGRAHKQISAERKERLKPVLNKDIRTLCDKETSDSKYLFGENLLESMKEAKESFRISNILVNNYSPKLQKVSYQSGSKRSFGYTNGGAGARFSASHSLNFQGGKWNHQHRGQSSSSTKYITSKKLHKY